jgi:hypothetical protein
VQRGRAHLELIVMWKGGRPIAFHSIRKLSLIRRIKTTTLLRRKRMTFNPRSFISPDFLLALGVVP